MGIEETILESVKMQICEEVNKVTHSSKLPYTLLDIISSVGEFYSFETSIKVNVVSNPEKQLDVSLDLMVFSIDEVKAMASMESETTTKIKGIQKALNQKKWTIDEIADVFEVNIDFVLKVQKGEVK